MPAGKTSDATGAKTAPGAGSGAAATAGGRTSFRPPWVRDGPNPLPMPQAPWTLNKRGSIAKDADAAPPDVPSGRKSSTIKIVPVQPAENGTTTNAKDPHTFERPKLREVPKAPPKEQKLQSREVKVPVSLTTNRRESKDLPQKLHIDTTKKEKEESIPKVELKPVPRDEPKKKETLPKVELKSVKKTEIKDKDGPLDKAVPSERNAIVRQESMKKVCPAPPPMPPPPPPPPELPFVKREALSRSQLEKLDSLRARPRKRPDWGAMMKDIETGKKLKHVQCNDRSQPLLPENTVKGQFIYESEKANLHNQLLKQIQTGANLKHVKCNDRSKPILEGLRKFRRQMTIEEKIIKSQSIASMPPEEIEDEIDEMDDIDKVRDDLQSTKQMLALELRNKEAQIRENKRLLARLANLEAELEKFKNAPPPTNKEATPTPQSPIPSSVDEKLVKTLKNEAEEARKTAEEMEKKYHQTADELFTVKTDLDEVKKQNALLEKKLQQTMQGGGIKRQSISDRRESVKQEEEEFSEEEETESEEDDGEDNEEKQIRRAEREVRLMRNKLKSYKNKLEAAKRERKNLRNQMKQNQHSMKNEKKKYKNLQKEVNKMAALMKDDEEDEDDEDKEDAEEEEETETEEESETESESESSEEEESSESEDEDAPLDKKKENLTTRVKRHENCLNALKKGNYMLKANVDRLQDDLNKQKEMVLSLQEDLDSVLAELG